MNPLGLKETTEISLANLTNVFRDELFGALQKKSQRTSLQLSHTLLNATPRKTAPSPPVTDFTARGLTIGTSHTAAAWQLALQNLSCKLGV